MKRKKIKTILCHMAIITICMGVFCHGYIMGTSLSKYDRLSCYASADNWTSCDTSDLATAFRYYCKSRNLVLDGSVADALTSFTTTTFNNICSTIGIDPTTLSAELKKTTDGNLGLRFLFSRTGVNFYNRIFAEFLQNNNLEVGDTVDNEVVYSGKLFTDNDGNSCFVYIVNKAPVSDTNPDDFITKFGSPYIYDHDDIMSFSDGQTVTFNITSNQSISLRFNVNYSYDTFKNIIMENWGYVNYLQGWGNLIYYGQSYGAGYVIEKGHMAIIEYNGNLYIGDINQGNAYQGAYPNGNFIGNRMYGWNGIRINTIPSDLPDTDITVDTPGDTTINNNTYNNNFTIIYNDGDVYYTDDDDEPLPTTPPGGGGGGGGDEPGDWNPTTPNIPNPSSPDFPSIDLPDIDIPDLPSLNFSLGDLRTKFPFSLPFDIIAVLNVLDGEPQAPHIQATVPIGQWYTWEMDFDFAEFDNYARIFRAFEFIGFCIGLAVFTVHFVKG